MPGIHDARMHPHMYGAAMKEVDLRPHKARTLQEMLDAVAKRAKTPGPGEWVLGRGYDESELDVLATPTGGS